MPLESIQEFLKWSAIIHFCILMIWILALKLAPSFLLRQQTFWFPISKETFFHVNYQLYGLYKILVLIFVFIPFFIFTAIGS